MITKRKSSQPGFVRVCFELPACLWADHVYVVGDFNNWEHRQIPLQQGRDGIWRVELDLPCGHCFQFRYYVDDHWLTDNHADGMTASPYGSQNSIVNTHLPVEALNLETMTNPIPFIFQQKGPNLSLLD